jgi:hypothetical protein
MQQFNLFALRITKEDSSRVGIMCHHSMCTDGLLLCAILSLYVLPILSGQILLQAKSFRQGCPNLKKQDGFLLAPCVKNWSHKSQSANSGERRKVHLHIFLMSALDEGDLLAACLSHLNSVECLPDRKLGVHENKCGCCLEKTHCL